MSASTGVAGEDASSAVALVNTRHLQSGQPADLLADPTRAAEWLAERGLLSRGAALPDPDTARLVALREAVRGLFAAKAGQRVPAVDDVTLLNAALAAAPAVPALTWDEAGPHRRHRAARPRRAAGADGPSGSGARAMRRSRLRAVVPAHARRAPVVLRPVRRPGPCRPALRPPPRHSLTPCVAPPAARRTRSMDHPPPKSGVDGPSTTFRKVPDPSRQPQPTAPRTWPM